MGLIYVAVKYPAEAWEKLSPQEVAATRRVKLRSPRQYVANVPAAKEAARRAKAEARRLRR